jgi:hypothetical protein
MKMLERHYDEITARIEDRTQLQAFEISDVADWWFRDSRDDAWRIADDIPCAAPPFPVIWMEYSAKRIETAKGVIDFGAPFEVGGLAFTYRGEQLDYWNVSWFIYVSIRKRIVHVAGCLLQLEPNFGAIEHFTYKAGNISRTYSPNGENKYPQFMGEPDPWVYPFIWATALTHAKNVHLVDDPLPLAVAKRRQREGKPAITFKVLDIRSMRKQVASATEGGATGAKRAMHIVRGHFKDYRESGGLFGKHKGLFWWDTHVAGVDSERKVIKDYRIVPPD